MQVSLKSPLKNKTVVYVITKANWGGAQKYVFDLLVESKKSGYTPHLAYGVPGLLNERVAEHGIPTHRIQGLVRDPSVVQDLLSLFALRKLFIRLRADTVHLNSSKAGFVGAVAGRLAGVKNIIFTAHGWSFTEDRSAISKAFFIFFHYFTVLLSHSTIVVSKSLATRTEKWPFVQNKIHIVHLGIEAPVLLTREEARKKLISTDPSLATTPNALWVGTIAELHPNKGLDIGIEGWKNYLTHSTETNSQWIVLGGGEKESDFRKLSEDISSIHFLGFVPNAAQYLKAFDLFLLPSRTEALGYVLIEAGISGLPILASNVGGIPETVPTTNDLFPVGDYQALSSRLDALLSHPEELSRIGLANKEFSAKEFLLSRMCRETFRLY